MKAICVTPERALEIRDIPAPIELAVGHVLVDMAAAAINHGDKAFLKMAMAAGSTVTVRRDDVWGASGSGTVAALGVGVPTEYMGKQVAIYRSLGRSPESIGMWCEKVQVPYTSCLILPDHVDAKDYCGSLVNVMTAYAFLEEIIDAGHKGVIVTAGNSATGLALAALARKRNMPALFLSRSEVAAEILRGHGVEHVIVTKDGFEPLLERLSAELGATAVFDGVGGDLPGRIAPSLPVNSAMYLYGFLGGNVPFSIQSSLFMMKNLSVKRFSNFESSTVKEAEKLVAALKTLEGVIEDPIFRTKIGREFRYEQIELAMAYESRCGDKAILVP